jgi:SOS-response transcriptional repressor LexA
MNRKPPDLNDTILTLIRDHMTNHGYPPSVGELVGATGAGRATVHARLQQLQRDGRIRITPGRARAITIIEEGAPE